MLNSALFDKNEESLCQLFERMRNDDVKKHARRDPLILLYASLRMESLGIKEDQKINDVLRVSQVTRSLVRLVREAQQVDPTEELQLDDLIKPANFDLVVKTTLKMALHVENPAISVGKRLGHTLAHVIAMKIGLSLRKGDKRKQNEAEDFKKLFESEWNLAVNSSCAKRQNKINRTKTKKIPLTEDLKLLREHITREMKRIIYALEVRVLPELWTSLAKYTLCRLILFNMRRQAEVKDLTVHDYINRPDWSQDQVGEFDMALSPADRILAKRMDMVIAAGKSRKNVDAFVLLPPDAKEAIETLIKHRGSIGVSETNKYIFARRNADSPLSGTEELRKSADACPGLVHPERISSNALRKYIATVSQILDMTDKEVEMLAVHLGHDVKTHKENYRLAHSTRELTLVAQLLLTVEKGNINKWRNKSLHEINGQETFSELEGAAAVDDYDDDGNEEIEVYETQVENSRQDDIMEDGVNELTEVETDYADKVKMSSKRRRTDSDSDSDSRLPYPSSSVKMSSKRRRTDSDSDSDSRLPYPSSSVKMSSKRRRTDSDSDSDSRLPYPSSSVKMSSKRRRTDSDSDSDSRLPYPFSSVKMSSKRRRTDSDSDSDSCLPYHCMRKRRTWTSDEIKALRGCFGSLIKDRIYPSSSQINSAQKTFPVLVHRTKAQIKAKLQNMMKKSTHYK